MRDGGSHCEDKRAGSIDFLGIATERKIDWMSRMRKRRNHKFRKGEWVDGNNTTSTYIKKGW